MPKKLKQEKSLRRIYTGKEFLGETHSPQQAAQLLKQGLEQAGHAREEVFLDGKLLYTTRCTLKSGKPECKVESAKRGQS